MDQKRISRQSALIAAGLLFLSAQILPAQSGTPSPSRVTLFTSGVAEFVHETEIRDRGTVYLTVPEDEMSDVVRSLTVLDRDGGTVYQIDYTSGESLNARLGRFRIDLRNVDSLADLAAAIRGNEVVLTRSNGPEARGRVLAVSGNGPNEPEGEIVLLQDGSATRYPLASIEDLQIVDAYLSEEVARALDVLGDSVTGENLRTIAIQLRGPGERRIVLRYLRSMPVWKTSYRAVLGEDQVFLQGWAHIDNTSSVDWQNTEVRLVSASPQSYFFDMYPPQFVRRDRVSPIEAEAAGLDRAPAQRSRPMASAMPESGFSSADLASSAPPQTSSNQSTSGITFTVESPVTLPRGESAMIPLVNGNYDAEMIRSWRPDRDGTRPLLSFSFENATGGPQLPGGPLTIYDGERYVGDALLPVTPAGAERVVSYARDLRLTVRRDSPNMTSEFRTFRVSDGMLVAESRGRRETTYHVQPDGDLSDLPDLGREGVPSVRIEHLHGGDWDLVSPRGAEESGAYRLIMTQGRETTVVEERIYEQRFVLGTMSRETLISFTSNRLMEPRVRRILENVRELRDRVSDTERARVALERERNGIYRDQERISNNMANLDRDSALYRRYLNQLDDQETRLGFLEEDLAEAREAEEQARSALNAYLATLTE